MTVEASQWVFDAPRYSNWLSKTSEILGSRYLGCAAFARMCVADAEVDIYANAKHFPAFRLG